MLQMICCGAHGGDLVRLRIIIPLAALFSPGMEARLPAQSSEASMNKKIDALFSGVTSCDAPGLAVFVRNDGRTVFERGYGVRDVRSQATINGHANFRLASFTKQFTAMAIMLLVHDGRLRYDQALTEI